MLLSHHQNAQQNINKKIANRTYENVTKFKYLGMKVTNQNFIQEEIKMRLNLGNACYHSLQKLFAFRMLYKKVKLEYTKLYFFLAVLYGCETWSLLLRKEHRLKICENRVLRRISEPKRVERIGGWRTLHNEKA
jgi:hypothetical protein